MNIHIFFWSSVFGWEESEEIQLIRMPRHIPFKSAAILSRTIFFSVSSTYFLWAQAHSLSLSRKKDTDQFILLAEVFVCPMMPCRYLASWK